MPAPSIFPSEIDVIGSLPFVRRIAAAARYVEAIEPLLLWPEIFHDSPNLVAEWVVQRREYTRLWESVINLSEPKGVENPELKEIRREIRMDAMRRLDMALFGSETFDPQSMWGGLAVLPKTLTRIAEKRITIKVGASKTQKIGTPPNYEKEYQNCLRSDIVDEIEALLWPLRAEGENEELTLEKWKLWKGLESLRQWEKENNLPSTPVHLKIVQNYLPAGYSMSFTEEELDEAKFPLTALIEWKLPIVWSDAFAAIWENRPEDIRKWEREASADEIIQSLRARFYP